MKLTNLRVEFSLAFSHTFGSKYCYFHFVGESTEAQVIIIIRCL